MKAPEFFLKLLVVLLSAKLCAEVFNRAGIPSVLGEVVAGIIIGPSVLGYVAPDATFHLLAEIGILLLLFEVGLETDVGQLIKEGARLIPLNTGCNVLTIWVSGSFVAGRIYVCKYCKRL